MHPNTSLVWRAISGDISGINPEGHPVQYLLCSQSSHVECPIFFRRKNANVFFSHACFAVVLPAEVFTEAEDAPNLFSASLSPFLTPTRFLRRLVFGAYGVSTFKPSPLTPSTDATGCYEMMLFLWLSQKTSRCRSTTV